MKRKQSSSTTSMDTEKKQKKLPLTSDERAFAEDFLTFKNHAVTHFHAVEASKKLLLADGYKELFEKTGDLGSQVTPGGKYFFTRNQSTIFAFAVGQKWKPGNGFCVQAAHTDSPVPKVKPLSKVTKHGYLQVGVELYGGGLWHTWFDRDLSLAGRVIVATTEKDTEATEFEGKLVRIHKPLIRIPSLAIHLDSSIRTSGFKPNKQTHIVPILATQIKQMLAIESPDEEKSETSHHSELLSVVAAELGVSPACIRDLELCLYDTQPAAIGGLYDEFIFARGLDNLMMSFVTLRALMDSGDTLQDETQIRIVALFDNEEVGSSSTMGAASNMMNRVLAQLNQDPKTYDAAIRKSLLVSADMAHALHPCYPEKHEDLHKPAMHKGLVVKQNCNQRYATTAVTTFFIEHTANKHNIPIQKFVVRNDIGCGSTIGPILASRCGMRTVDVGIPQLAMHSIREMCGTADCESSYRLLKALFSDFSALDAKTHAD